MMEYNWIIKVGSFYHPFGRNKEQSQKQVVILLCYFITLSVWIVLFTNTQTNFSLRYGSLYVISLMTCYVWTKSVVLTVKGDIKSKICLKLNCKSYSYIFYYSIAYWFVLHFVLFTYRLQSTVYCLGLKINFV